MIQTLIKNKKYLGKYVAFKNFNDSTVVGFGKTPQEAYRKAFRHGYEDPVITFVPSKEMVHIF